MSGEVSVVIPVKDGERYRICAAAFEKEPSAGLATPSMSSGPVCSPKKSRKPA
jgi:hypothetical protein